MKDKKIEFTVGEKEYKFTFEEEVLYLHYSYPTHNPYHSWEHEMIDIDKEAVEKLKEFLK